ncbi:hypothetical protein LWF15_08760 [Kineosporia rhizophila]|uniref:glycosyltransferase family 9 protein n=1 Tax=Kineosporia rhizophila TaxID=84633 RepID=UPI001E55A559|nr:hypothetical protein [Kineosporia rhizophila]MCE0535600.1 hypothetical protein [Kineosporia rhizophila]
METVQTKVRRPRCRVSPGNFRRLIERFSPVVETGAVEASPRSVLVIRTDEVGDLAMTLPLLTSLRSAWPLARITLLTRGSRGEMMRGGALVDEVIAWPDLESTWSGSLSGQVRCWRLGRRLLHHSRPLHGRFDLAILPQPDAEPFGTRYVACTAALRVVGFDPADCFSGDERGLLTDPVSPGDPQTHALRHSERLASALGITITPDTYDAPGLALIGPADRAAARSLLSPLAPSPGPLIAVNLTARDWPPQSCAAVVNAVHARVPVRLALIGETSSPEDFLRTLDPSIPLVSAIGRAHPRTLLALLADSDLFLGGAGDEMHLASSVATACVVVGDPPAASAGPWSAGSQVVPGSGVSQAVLEVLTGLSWPVVGGQTSTPADRRVRLPA